VSERARVWGIVAVGALVVALAVAFSGSRSSPAAQTLRATLHPVDVLYAENQLARAADRGAPSGRLLALTNRLVDLVGDDSNGARRRAVDGALASLAGTACPLCEQALEDAR
jgi:hypothetical protein